MRYHHYFVKRFLIPRVDVSIDELNDIFKNKVSEKGIPTIPKENNIFMNTTILQVMLQPDGFYGPDHAYTYNFTNPISNYMNISMVCYNNQTQIQVVERDPEVDNGIKYEAAPHILLRNKINYIQRILSRAMAETLVEKNIISSVDEYFRGDCDLDGTPLHPEFEE